MYRLHIFTGYDINVFRNATTANSVLLSIDISVGCIFDLIIIGNRPRNQFALSF